MDLESILLEYGKLKNLGKLHLDSHGVCTLLINDNFLITFEKSLDKEGFFVYAAIGALPVGKEQELSLIALSGNLFGKETGRANIGYVEQSRSLVLFEYFDEDTIDYPHFSQRFNHFIQHLFYWVVKMEYSDQISNHSSLQNDTKPAHKKIFYA